MSFQTVIFRQDANDPGRTFNAVFVAQETPEVDEQRYTDVNWKRYRQINAKWLRWNIRFSYLSEADQDYLLALAGKSEPQMQLGADLYEIEIDRLRSQVTKGELTVINRNPEVLP